MLRTLRWDVTRFNRYGSLLVGFLGEQVFPKGNIELLLTLGEGKDAVTRVEEFVMVFDSMAYNSILRRQEIHHFKTVRSTYHQTMKCPTRNGMGIVDEQ